MTTTTKHTKRSRKTSPADEQIVTLRIEKRLKITAMIILKEREDGWSYDVSAEDQKQGYDLDYRDQGYDCEAAVLTLALDRLWEWLVELRRSSASSHGHRISTAADQVRVHARQLVPDWMPPDVPETQDQAQAKEAALDETPPVEHDDRPLLQRYEVIDVVVIETSRIDDHPRQPRLHYTGIEELAESFRRDGQLDEAMGRLIPVPGRGQERIELIRGHRRKRAAELAGLPLRIKIIACDDATALELIGIDDANWREFDAIAKARWYQAMAEATALSQRQLAERLGVSQPHIANHIRLLKLPAIWQQRVISGEITPTQSRDLATWSDVPAVLEDLDKSLPWNDPRELAECWEECLSDAVQAVSRPLRGGTYLDGKYVDVALTTKDLSRADLDIREVSLQAWGTTRKEQRAFNIDLWEELQSAGAARREKAAAKRRGQRVGEEDSADAAGVEGNQEQLAERHRKQEQQRAERVRRYKIDWLHQRIVAVLSESALQPTEAGEVLLLKLVLYYATHWRQCGREEHLARAIQERRGKRTKPPIGLSDRWSVLSQVESLEDLRGVIRTVVARWSQYDVWSHDSHLAPCDVPAIAAALGIDFAREWRLDREFLELHPRAQLQDLIREWRPAGVDVDTADSRTRSEIIEAILAADQARRLPPPRSLADKKRQKGQGQ